MGELLIKPYESSVWEDKLTPIEGSDPVEYKLKETKLAVIGSNTMTGLNKIYDPVFTKKVNGEKNLTFSLKYKYFDPYSGNEDVINPFAALLVNERKVKLHYDNQWYEFIVKDHTESSDEYTWTYTCTDAFVLELSKTGYNIEFSTDLNNNQGTAKELAIATLENTDWQLGHSDKFTQLIEEPIYEAVLESINDIEIINANTGEVVNNISANTSIYLFYSYVKNKNGKFIQFIIRDSERNYTIDDRNVIIDINYRITTELTYNNNGFYLDNILVISIGEIDRLYQANRLAYAQRTIYDPVMKRTVDIFQIGEESGGREVYKYTDYRYTTSNIVTNFIVNGDNFNVLDDGTLQGWNPYVNSSDNESIQPLELITRPELKDGKKLADLTMLSQIEGFLKVQFVGAVTNDYLNAIFNDGIQSNTSLINSISQGDEFVFRWRAGSGNINSLQPVQTLGLLIAKCTRDVPQRWGRYYYYIDTDDIILDIRATQQNPVQELNNIIEGGHIENTEDGQIYVIDGVAQSISTKYLYKDNDTLYYWDGENSSFEEKDNNYLPYYYLTSKAQKAVTNTTLTDPTVKYGIFIYTTQNNSPIYIQDIQFTRCLRDEQNNPVIIGNVPTATVSPTEYYYLKPSDGAAAEDVQTYTSLEDLQNALNTQQEIIPIYNEDSEKNLSISVSQSNCFNILQTIAETFECWVDLVVDHDDNGYITFTNNKPNKFVYLREYAGKDNWAGFKYGINLQSIERTVNSDEIVTKLIVDLSQSEYVDEGYVSIANSPSNPSGESYILNFDYYYSQGLLNREEVESDKKVFIENLKTINLTLQEQEALRRNLENALTSLGSKRNTYTELIDAAQDTQTEALGDFEYYTKETYENYKDWYNEYINTGILPEGKDDFLQEENVLTALGKLYSSSSVINNYSGILSNIETEYWNVRKQLRGSENYQVKVWREKDNLNQYHVFIEINDYLPGLAFTIGDYSDESTVSKKFFDISTNATTITFTAPNDYSITTNVFQIEDGSPIKFSVVSGENILGVEDEIDELIETKEELIKDFNNKYSRYIQEGTWNSTDYIDSELYYLDALQVSNISAQPIVSYTINVVEISELEGLNNYLFDTGDKTYIEDTEFFGWANKNGVLTPAREEVIVSQVEWHLEEPENNVITIQNYKTRFEDLFQRISAAVQTVQYNEATYAKISSLMDANGTINQDVLLASLNNISGQNYNLTSDGSVIIDRDRILVRNLTNPTNCIIINSEGIRISSDGGQTWRTAIDGQGINIGTVYTGTLNTNNVVIGSSDNPSFRWDKSGISAYKSTGTTETINNQTINTYDLQTFVRYDQYGLYGIKNNGLFTATSIEDIKEKAHFAVTWDGFFIKNSYPGGGRVEITSDNDFRVMNIPTGQIEEQEKIKIGALEWGKDNQDNPILSPNDPGATEAPTLYGIRINNNAGQTVMKTGDDGNLEITGTIYANAGEIGGMVVNNDWLRMNYIVLEPGEGIYSTYPNVKGETPIDPSISAYPFWISDTDGSAVFNNVTVRGSIKTSVFEYEEIQAVGGAFLFRPSSAIRLVTKDGNDLIFTVEKPGLFRVDDWLKVSNFSSADEQDVVTPDELNGFGLTYIYRVGAVNGRQIRLIGAAEILDEQSVGLDDLAGGSLIDMGRHSTKIIEGTTYDAPGDNNYGIGINSSDGFINLPPRAISLFETVIHPNSDPKVSYRYKGILGTLPTAALSNVNVDSTIYSNMEGTQGIYTDNMYIGDHEQYIAFYEDDNGEKQLKIKANQVIYEVVDEDTGESEWKDIQDVTQGVDGEDAITVSIDSSAGNVFLNKNIQTTLTCTVTKGNGTDITNQVTRFTWTKKNADGTVDSSWSRPLAGRSIILTDADVNSKAIFICEVEF